MTEIQIAMRRAWSTWAAGTEKAIGLPPNTPIPEILNQASELADTLAFLSENLQSECYRFGFETLEQFYEAVSASETD